MVPTTTPEQIQQLGTIIRTVRERLEINLRRLADNANVRRDFLRDLERGNVSIQRGKIFRVIRQLIFTMEEREEVYTLAKALCAPRHVRRRHIHVEGEKSHRLPVRKTRRNFYRAR